jgi:hypothetical protein
VIEVCLAAGNFLDDQIGVPWDDGGNDLPMTPALVFTLVSRPSQIIAASTEDIPPGRGEAKRGILQAEGRITRLAIVPEPLHLAHFERPGQRGDRADGGDAHQPLHAFRFFIQQSRSWRVAGIHTSA